LSTTKLTTEQQEAFQKNGYLLGLNPIFSTTEMVKLNAELEELTALLEPGEGLIKINGWHRSSRWLYDVCTHPQILAYVEGILGPNFFPIQ
jgi:hypothetical protein